VAEEKRIRRKPPQQMAAYDYVLAGRIHHHRVTSEDNAEALRMLETAIQLDPGFAEAYAWKACTLGQALQFGFCTDFAATEEEAFAAIDKALSLDENDVECHRLLCEVRMESRRFDQAETHSELALVMNPNDPRIVAQRGELLTWLGRPDEGVEWIEKAMRVDPFGAPGRAHLLGRAFYTARRYAEAIDAFKKIVSPSYMHLAEVAACHARIGDQVCANESAAAALRLNPDFSVDQYMQTRTYQNPADAAHLAEGMREAGLPA
jgi:adenylate cyclase